MQIFPKSKLLKAYASRMHVRSSFEAFSIAIFALTLVCACVASLALVVLGAATESADCCHVDEVRMASEYLVISMRPNGEATLPTGDEAMASGTYSELVHHCCSYPHERS